MYELKNRNKHIVNCTNVKQVVVCLITKENANMQPQSSAAWQVQKVETITLTSATTKINKSIIKTTNANYINKPALEEPR